MTTIIAVIVFNIQWPESFRVENVPKAASMQMAFHGILDAGTIAKDISKAFETSTGCQPSEFTWLILRSQEI